MIKQIKENELYFVIKINEPYARRIFQVLKEEQIKLGKWPEGDITFEEWVNQTFGKNGLDYINKEIK